MERRVERRVERLVLRAPVDRREEMGRQMLWRWRLRERQWRQGKIEGGQSPRQRVSNDGAE